MLFIIIGLLCATVFFAVEAHRKSRSGQDAQQHSNVKTLMIAIYQYLYQFRRLPESGADLRKIMPYNEEMEYFNPYTNRMCAFKYAASASTPIFSGDIRFTFHSLLGEVPDTIVICGYDGKGECLLETWIPMNVVNEA